LMKAFVTERGRGRTGEEGRSEWRRREEGRGWVGEEGSESNLHIPVRTAAVVFTRQKIPLLASALANLLQTQADSLNLVTLCVGCFCPRTFFVRFKFKIQLANAESANAESANVESVNAESANVESAIVNSQ
jgi:hypothetical protein